MAMLQGNTYLKPVQVLDSKGEVIGVDRVVKGEFVFGDLYKYYGAEDSEVVWVDNENAFVVPLTEEDTFSLQGAVECQVRLVLDDGSVSGSVPEAHYVYESRSKTRLTEGGAGEESGQLLVLKLLKEFSAGGGGTEGGTTNYNDLSNKPSINGVELKGNKTTQDLGIVSKENDPTVPEYVKNIKESDIERWNSKATEGYVDSKIANLVNSAPTTLDTLGEMAKALQNNESVVQALNSAIGNKANQTDLDALETRVDNITIPTKTSELTNDSGFITINDVPQGDVDLSNYYTKSETEEYVNSVVGSLNTTLESILGV